MKIENIIEDIKKDIIALKEKLEEGLKNQYPELIFTINLPGIDELTTIKSIAISVQENKTIYLLSVQIHTHNGNRVFENPPKEITGGQPAKDCSPHPFQPSFVVMIREIIRKNKLKKKSDSRSRNNFHQFEQTK